MARGISFYKAVWKKKTKSLKRSLAVSDSTDLFFFFIQLTENLFANAI